MPHSDSPASNNSSIVSSLIFSSVFFYTWTWLKIEVLFTQICAKKNNFVYPIMMARFIDFNAVCGFCCVCGWYVICDTQYALTRKHHFSACTLYIARPLAYCTQSHTHWLNFSSSHFTRESVSLWGGGVRAINYPGYLGGLARGVHHTYICTHTVKDHWTRHI